MLLTQPLTSITPTLDGAILQVLARADSTFTVGQLMDRIGGSYNGIRRTLERLTRQGVVRASRAGRTTVYELNRHHLAAGPIIELASLHAVFLRRLREHISTWEVRPAYAAMFGSAARGDMREDSDIDLFIVRKDTIDDLEDVWFGQLETMTQTVTAWTGNDTRVLQYARHDVFDSYGKDPVLDFIEEDAVHLSGALGFWQSVKRGR